MKYLRGRAREPPARAGISLDSLGCFRQLFNEENDNLLKAVVSAACSLITYQRSMNMLCFSTTEREREREKETD